MKLVGKYRESNGTLIGGISEIGIIQIGKSKDDFFKNIKNEINSIISSDEDSSKRDYKISNFDNYTFTIEFSELKSFSAFIFKAIRKNEKMSQAKIASKLDIVRASYSQYEEEKKEPTLGKFSEVLKAFGYDCEINIKKISRLKTANF
nr:hypothetical protein GTC16762_31370 [Pigmentibacter ruber]